MLVPNSQIEETILSQAVLSHHVQSARLLFSFFVFSISSPVAANDINAGEQIYKRSCAACHGAAAKGNEALGGPHLAGQHQSYLTRQLENFSQGIRGSDKTDIYGQQMVAMVAIVGDSESKVNVSAYLASLDKPYTSITEDKTGNGSNAGYKVYQASCGACHGADGSGNERLNSPSLVGQSSAYLLRQYANFLDGKRGSHESDKLGRQMKMIASTVTDQAKIDAAIAYLISLQDET